MRNETYIRYIELMKEIRRKLEENRVKIELEWKNKYSEQVINRAKRK